VSDRFSDARKLLVRLNDVDREIESFPHRAAINEGKSNVYSKKS